MTFTEYAKVKNVLVVQTKFGRRKVCNVTTDRGDEAIWANDLNAFSNIKPGQTINVIRGAKGGLTILEKSPSMNEVINGNGSYGNTPSTQTYFQPNRNGSNTSSNNEQVVEDLIHDVPMLSDLDKKKVAKFIDQQARLYRYTVDTVAKQFPELVGVDDRGIRSIALSLLINTNHMINRNL